MLKAPGPARAPVLGAGAPCSPSRQHPAHGETLECLREWKRPSGARPQGESVLCRPILCCCSLRLSLLQYVCLCW